MELNFPKLERKILKYWKQNGIFEKSIKQRAGARDFVFYEGPPTANARPGIHHVLSRVYKDVVCRYKTMRGFRVLRKAGWDTHGLPVELEIEKKLGLKSKKEIEKHGIAKFNAQCKQSVWQYKKEWEKLTERIGFWLDMEHPYITYENDYIETLWWIIKQIWNKGLLYQDYKVVPYCPRCGTALSSHEVALGYKTVKEPAIYVKLKMKNEKFKNSYLLVWTTTPWTLPGNAAVAIKPELIYVSAKKDSEVLILAKERIAVLGGGCEVIGEFKGKDLLGVEYEPLFPVAELGKKAYFVIAGDFISAQEGTGLVHIAPAFGEDDMEVGKNNNLPVLITVDSDGRFNAEVKQWAGMFVKDADPLIIEDLKKRGLLFKEELYEHDYPFCWRCSSPLLYYAKESWFVRVSKLKDQLSKNNQKINWVPAYLREGRFGEWLKEVKDWAFSRERYWGTPLPIWKCKQCGKHEVIGGKEDLERQSFTRNKYFVMRHGHSLRQVNNRIASWPEKFRCPLTREGMEHVKKQAVRLKKEKINIIYASDLLRTRQTAEIVAEKLGVPIKLDKRLRELGGGVFNGQNINVFQKWGGWNDPMNRFSVRPPRGEHYMDVKKRVYDFLLDVDRKHKNKTILIVGHELPTTVLECAARGFSREATLEYRLEKRIGTGEYRRLPFAVWPYNKNSELDFHRPFIDRVKFLCPKCGERMERVPEVADVWFDSGAMPFASASVKAKADKEGRIKPPEPFPADYICEAVDQTRGWFYTLLAASTLLGFGPPYKNVISLGHVLDEKGEKMSKSKGNTVDPWQVIEKYGTDAVRWYFYSVNQPGDPKLFAESDVEGALKKFIFIFWNSYVFLKTYGGKTAGWKGNKRSGSRHLLDRWIVSRLYVLSDDVSRAMEKYDITLAARSLEKFTVEDLSQWYIRRSRRRFQKPEIKQELREAADTLGFVLLSLAKLSAPFVPFISENVYLGLSGGQSVHLEKWPEFSANVKDAKLEEDMRRAREIVQQALSERAKAGIKVRQPLGELRLDGKHLKKNADLLEIIREETNVKKISFGEHFSLDTEITPGLREEGFIRELVRHIQEMRKKAGLKPHHKIAIYFSGTDNFFAVLQRNKGIIAKETKTKELNNRQKGKRKLTIEQGVTIDGEKIWIGVRKVG
ncbi:MAG: isoleucine--tRNA ligase [Candidatus Wildermuthbacteria bacterium RIFCSPLOWO2_01_FULL_48_35]|uniref:Isoleucine--tRNA ligase n=2 Tax=Candidatus Wildermuthiibacteriota TaxID=1817923 RepID=A0A1G2RR72_9BACT|nr:MAG: Isoleucine-tRNA ligase [Parcubacteria group bacterium GW2011_GWA2_47_9]OHA68716.1 MAG: isoleucine--tRNA ligase [Candidatus Wildermuthbacteria bacterium RIFCSPHIGHO2_02_FULL_47_17]OHA75327.1 MAG: isoleucine--tRNA ligase [Candidatus Wildermuthbacteria bacterium RIFCSPLOWO2_01_FULL_48_35]